MRGAPSRSAPGRLGVALCLCLALGACDDPPEPETPGLPPVHTLVVLPSPFEDRVRTTGVVELPDDATLSAEVGGTVVQVVEEGATVAAGQVVAQLDAGAELAGLLGVEGAVAEARAVAEQAEEAFRRQAPLARDTIISALELQRIETERAQAGARLAQTRAQLREAEERLEQTRLRAPFAGTVEQAFVRPGEQVSPGQEVIRILRPGRAEVTAGVAERYAGRVTVGSPATVDFQAYGLGERQAPVARVGNAVDPQSRTFSAVIELPNTGGAIKANMVASVHIVSLVLPDALVLPLEAVERDERGESVLLAVERGGVQVAVRRAVVTGPRSERGVVVESGLQPGDQVIVFGGDDAGDDEAVDVVRRYATVEEFRAALAAADANVAGPRP